MEEFHPRRKMANAYFLVLASLQTIPQITNTFGVPTILLPLSVVVIADAIFAILEVRALHFVGCVCMFGGGETRRCSRVCMSTTAWDRRG